MQCEFLDYSGGILWGGYRCRRTDKPVDKNTINTYCDNSLKYKDCPAYDGCYLTTAMCNILGYEDDCLILNTLRNFRDNYMKNTKECLPLLEDYDTVGPIIADKLTNDKNKVFNAKSMLYFYIYPALVSIKKENYDEAIELYKDMTISLMHTYNIDRSLLASKKTTGSNITRKRELVNV